MRILIIDGHNVFHRGWYTLPKEKQNPHSALAQFKLMVGKLRREIVPDVSVICWDGGHNAERVALYKDYKAGRPPKPKIFYDSLDLAVETIRNVDLYISERHNGVEADDIIGMIARYYDLPGNSVLIASDDKDFLQLASKNITIIHSQKGTIDSTRFKETFGFPPPQFADYLALTGDDGDNIPGVAKIGEKIAQYLVVTYGTIEQIYDKIEQVELKYRKNLEIGKANAFLSKSLILLRHLPNLSLDWMIF